MYNTTNIQESDHTLSIKMAPMDFFVLLSELRILY